MRLAFWKRNRKKMEMPEGLKVKVARPPVWDSVCAAFKLINPAVYFTYGDTIYNPANLPIPIDIAEHERVHMKQQNFNDKDAAIWWGRYLRDPKFRIEQEAQAYARQYEVLCDIYHDREERHRLLMRLAQSLSGPLYNNAIGIMEATILIKSFTKAK